MKPSRIDEMIRRQEGLTVLNRQALEAVQLKKLNDLLAREQARQGFYVNLPSRLDSLGGLSTLPFTTEEDLARRGNAMVLVSQSHIQRVLSDATSGTTGTPKRVFYTPADCRNTIKLYKAGLGELVFPGSKTMSCMPFSGPFGLGELIAAAIEELGAIPLKVGVGQTFGQLKEILDTQRPDTYVGIPGQLCAMLTALGKGSLERCLVSADACPASMTARMESILGTKLYPHYGSREMGMAGAITCPAHQGMHLRENHIIAEIVNEKGLPLPPGETGELVITTIGMEAQPLIRYRTGDFTRILPEPCPCGSCTLRLDALHRRGEAGAILPLDEALFALPGLVDAHIRREGDGLHITALTLPGFDENTVRQAVPGAAVQCREVTLSDRPLYLGKRRIE